jgi:hypothetical protein
MIHKINVHHFTFNMYIHKVFHRSFVMAIVMYALNESTCVYEVQVESFLGIYKMLYSSLLFLQMTCIHV